MEQMDLFEEQYKTLNELRELIESFHWTGGINSDGTYQYETYELEFYKDLAFIVQFRSDTDNNERVIDNCCELELVENNLYKIIKIDGKTLGDIIKDSPAKTRKQVELIESMQKEELWKKL